MKLMTILCALVSCATLGSFAQCTPEKPGAAREQKYDSEKNDEQEIAQTVKPHFGTILWSGSKALVACAGFTVSLFGTAKGIELCLVALSKLDRFKYFTCVKQRTYFMQRMFSLMNKTLSLEKRIDDTMLKIYAGIAGALLIGIPACIWWGKMLADSARTFLDSFPDPETTK